MLPLLDTIMYAPPKTRNQVRVFVSHELIENELIDGGEAVTARGVELEALIDVLGPLPWEGREQA
jgi:hypothetical protein